MTSRGLCGGSCLAVLLLGSLVPAQDMFPPEVRGDMEARLTVRADDHTDEPGLGAVTLTLTVTGPDTLEVEAPHLGDPTAAWKEERPPHSRRVQDGRARWEQVIRLKQLKKGAETVPDVSVRFRDGPDAAWEEAKWVDILKQVRELPGPPAPAEAPWPRRWGPVIAGGLVALLLVGTWAARRRRPEAPPPPPGQVALREIERIEQTLLPPQGDAEAFHTQLSLAVRRYLAQRFGLHALEQTTAEFLEAVRQAPGVAAERQALLRELFERCDLAKFARAGTPPEECLRSAELARELVRQTSEPSGR
jgi:hypothetical protein